MNEVIGKIEQASWEELQILMKAIEDRYAVAFPDWSVTYTAVHVDYKRCRKDTRGIMKRLKQGVRYSKKQAKKDSLR